MHQFSVIKDKEFHDLKYDVYLLQNDYIGISASIISHIRT